MIIPTNLSDIVPAELPALTSMVKLGPAGREYWLSDDEKRSQAIYRKAFYDFKKAPDDLKARKADFMNIWSSSCLAGRADESRFQEKIAGDGVNLDEPIEFKGITRPLFWWWLVMMFQSNHECRSVWDISSLEAVYKAIHKFTAYEVRHLFRIVYNRFRKTSDGKLAKYVGKSLRSAFERATNDHNDPERPDCFSTEDGQPLPHWIIFQEEDAQLLVQLERICYWAYGGPLTLLNGEVPKSAALSQHADAIGFDFLQPNGRLLKIRPHKDARKCRLHVSISPTKTDEEYCFRFAQRDHDGGTLNAGDLVTIRYTLQAADDGEVYLVFTVDRLNEPDSWTRYVNIRKVLRQHPQFESIVKQQLPNFSGLIDRLMRSAVDSQLIRTPGIQRGERYGASVLLVNYLKEIWLGIWREGEVSFVFFGYADGNDLQEGVWSAWLAEGKPISQGGLLQLWKGKKLSDVAPTFQDATDMLKNHFTTAVEPIELSTTPVVSLNKVWLAMASIVEQQADQPGFVTDRLFPKLANPHKVVNWVFGQISEGEPSSLRAPGLKLSYLFGTIRPSLPDLNFGVEPSPGQEAAIVQFSKWLAFAPSFGVNGTLEVLLTKTNEYCLSLNSSQHLL